MANSRAMWFWKFPGKATGLEVSLSGMENDRAGVVVILVLPLPAPAFPVPLLRRMATMRAVVAVLVGEQCHTTTLSAILDFYEKGALVQIAVLLLLHNRPREGCAQQQR